MIADAILRGDLHRIGSVGTEQLGIEVRIGGADDAALPTGEVGEVLVRGPTVMREYWGNSEATARTLANGWLHTGDLGALDADGFVTLKDRSKDLVISGGSNIYPREVENAALAPRRGRGRGVRASASDVGARRSWRALSRASRRAATRRGGASRPHWMRTVVARSLRFKRPRQYLFVDALPTNSAGKVLKTVLRERFLSDRPS